MLMILDPPPSSSEMFDFDPHHEEEQAAYCSIQCGSFATSSSQQCYSSATARALQQCLATASALQLSAWLDSARCAPGHSNCKPRLCVHINATLLSTDFDKIWLFHINPVRH